MLVQPVHVYEVGITVQSALNVIDVPTSGIVLLALRLHETGPPGNDGPVVEGEACQLIDTDEGAEEPFPLVANTEYT